jgi:hypothetical protein
MEPKISAPTTSNTQSGKKRREREEVMDGR